MKCDNIKRLAHFLAHTKHSNNSFNHNILYFNENYCSYLSAKKGKVPRFSGFSEVGGATCGTGQKKKVIPPLRSLGFSFPAPLARQTRPVQEEFIGKKCN